MKGPCYTRIQTNDKISGGILWGDYGGETGGMKIMKMATPASISRGRFVTWNKYASRSAYSSRPSYYECVIYSKYMPCFQMQSQQIDATLPLARSR